MPHLPPGWVPPPPPQLPPTNRFAIASAVLSPFGGVLGLIFGIVALVQIRRNYQQGRQLAINGIAISLITMVVLGILLALHLNTGGYRPYANYLTAGQCVNGLADATQVGRLPVVACNQPHDAEVFAAFPLPGAYFEVNEKAEAGCGERLPAYAPDALSDPRIEVQYLLPTEEGFRRGDLNIVCLLVDARGQHTGSLRTVAG